MIDKTSKASPACEQIKTASAALPRSIFTGIEKTYSADKGIKKKMMHSIDLPFREV